MATAPTSRPAPVQQATRPPRPAQAAPPEMPDFETEMEEEGKTELDDLYHVFATEGIAPPPVKRLGRQDGALNLPYDKLTVVNQWFLIPPFSKDKETFKKEKQRLTSSVYKRRRDGRKFKLIEIDERFANAIKHPELKGRHGVWRVA